MTLLVILIIGCGYNIRYYRTTTPKDRLDVSLNNGTALIRTLHADIRVKYADQDLLKKIQFSPCYTLQTNTENYEKPQESVFFTEIPLDIFMIIIKNRSNKPISGIDISIVNSDKQILPVTSKEFKEKNLYKFYNNIDLSRICEYRRIINENMELAEIDFDRDTFPYDFRSIIPDDMILFLIPFNTNFKDDTAFKLKISYSVGNLKKVIDFDFTYFEYRYDSEKYKQHLFNEKEKNRREKEENQWL